MTLSFVFKCVEHNPHPGKTSTSTVYSFNVSLSLRFLFASTSFLGDTIPYDSKTFWVIPFEIFRIMRLKEPLVDANTKYSQEWSILLPTAILFFVLFEYMFGWLSFQFIVPIYQVILPNGPFCFRFMLFAC